MRRRQFLANGVALLSATFAGCGHPSVVLDMEKATTDDIANEVSMTVDPDSEAYPVISSAIENESATRSGRYDLFDRTNTVRFNGSFYDVSETRVENSEITVYEVLIDFDPNDSTAKLGAINYDELPEVDRQHLAPIVTGDTPPRQAGYDVGVDYGSVEEVGNESVFIPDRQYDILIYNETRYRIAVNSRTAPEAEYRYEITEVASSVEAFADQVREQYLFTLSGLSDAERKVVEEAIESGYFQGAQAAIEATRISNGHRKWTFQTKIMGRLSVIRDCE